MPECCKLSKKIEVSAGGGYTDEQIQHFLGGSFQKYYLEILVIYSEVYFKPHKQCCYMKYSQINDLYHNHICWVISYAQKAVIMLNYTQVR